MLKKLFLSLIILLSLCISVCADDLSYDFSQKIINNTGKYAIVKKDGELYFSGEKENIEIALEKGDKFTLLKWNSYEDIKPLTEPVDYTLYEINFVCEGQVVSTGYGFKGCEISYPQVPEKNGYEVKWSVAEKNDYILVAQAEYEICDYDVLFYADDDLVVKRTYNINNTSITEPAVPKKEGYNGKWESYALTYGDVIVNAVYTPIEYAVTFEGENGVVAKENFNIENMNIEEPIVPEKAGYSGTWEEYTLSLKNITVKAVYDVIDYKALFIADGETVSSQNFNVENMNVTEPDVPEKAGYTGKWESYELKLSDAVVNAVYTPIQYKVTFKAENFEEVKKFTVENLNVTEPIVPEKTGYTGVWEEYELSLSDITVNAVYTPCKYIISFDCTDGKIEVTYGEKYPALPTPENSDVSKYFIGWYIGEVLIAEGNEVEITENSCLAARWADKSVYDVTYSDYYQDGSSMTVAVIDGEKTTEPKTPVKTGYTFINWQTATGEIYDFDKAVTNNVTLYPKWEVVDYTVTFVADGIVVDVKTYNVENKKVENPTVPNKTGYTKKWESYTLTYGNVIVNAVYTPITYYLYFMDETGNNLVATVSYTVEDKKINEPEVPEKTGYTGKWKDYKLYGSATMVYPQYTLIGYTVTFVADGSVVDTKTYTITNKKITEPVVPEKPGYTGKWESYSLNLSDVTVKAIYTPIEYKVTFVAEEKIVAEEKYTVENMMVYTPAVPEKTGYTAKWEEFSLNLEDITVNAVYTPIKYTITFVADGKEISSQTYTVENMQVTEPSVPEKTGYTGKWEAYSLELKNKNVKAIYTLNEYKATFKVDGETVSQQSFNVENMQVVEPVIPEKSGYTAKWESYTLELEDITINAVYEIINYNIKFVADGNVVLSQNFNVENMEISEPTVPQKSGYTGKWSAYSKELENITVTAIYTPITYTAKFVVDGVEISSVNYNVENTKINEPAVPEKEWYDGKWETYSLGVGGATINAVYTIADYEISFKADGKVIGTQNYNLNNQMVTFPSIPEKTGFRGVWEKYEVVPGGMEINVRYISEETDAENAEEKFHYTNMVTDFGKHAFTGNERIVVENIQKVGESILADIDYGVEITEEYIRANYSDIINETKEVYKNISNKTKFKGDVARLIKDDSTYEYFEDFADKYL